MTSPTPKPRGFADLNARIEAALKTAKGGAPLESFRALDSFGRAIRIHHVGNRLHGIAYVGPGASQRIILARYLAEPEITEMEALIADRLPLHGKQKAA